MDKGNLLGQMVIIMMKFQIWKENGFGRESMLMEVNIMGSTLMINQMEEDCIYGKMGKV